MTGVIVSSRARWAVPAVVVVAVAGAVAATAAAAGAAPPDVAPRSAAQLLGDLAAPTTVALSGTVVETSRLGLPQLPGGASGGLGPLSLAMGSNTLRVWANGPDHNRVALLGQLAEYDAVRSGSDVWTYSNQQNKATHYVLPPKSAHTAEPRTPGEVPSTPAQAAADALAAIDPSTAVAVQASVTVASRAARQLVLTPKDTASLVGSVRVAVDAATSVPLRVQVFSHADASTPAFEVGFTDISFTAPDPSVFAFTPPAGAQVSQSTVPQKHGGQDRGAQATPDKPSSSSAAPTVLGTGWTSIAVFNQVDLSALSKAQSKVLNEVTTRVGKGRLLSTGLVSVLLTDDGRVLVGAVTPQALQAAA